MELNSISPGELKGLTEQVTAELKKRLGGIQEGFQEGIQDEKELGRRLDIIKEREETGRRLLVLGMASPEEKAFLENSFQMKYDASLQGWDMLLLLQMSPETMAYVAHGIFGNREAACILHGLLEGKKIFLLQSGLLYRSYRETASKNLYSLYLQQEDTLRNLGVEMIAHVSDMKTGKRANCGEAFDFRHFGLVREADLFPMRTSGAKVIRLGRDTKITPLAMDFIKNHNLSLQRE